jgi:dimethylargininase
MPIALTRPVPDSLAQCELTHLERTPIDVARAREQHERYEARLQAAGCTVERIEAGHDLPDSVFVEDTAIVLDEIAIVTRPGAPSRVRETAAVAAALAKYRQVVRMVAPATLDGGDVLRLGRALYVGLSTRTNEAGARQLAAAAQPFGYTVRCARVRGCLHLKSAATALDDRIVLCNPEWIDPGTFEGCDTRFVHPGEPFGANVLRIDSIVVTAAAHERTAAALLQQGYDVRPVDVSELAKAEAGVTCCSLMVT